MNTKTFGEPVYEDLDKHCPTCACNEEPSTDQAALLIAALRECMTERTDDAFERLHAINSIAEAAIAAAANFTTG